MTPEEIQAAVSALGDPVARDEELERRQIIAFHEARLNWRLQRAFEDHCRQMPGVQALRRAGVSGPFRAKPQGFA